MYLDENTLKIGVTVLVGLSALFALMGYLRIALSRIANEIGYVKGRDPYKNWIMKNVVLYSNGNVDVELEEPWKASRKHGYKRSETFFRIDGKWYVSAFNTYRIKNDISLVSSRTADHLEKIRIEHFLKYRASMKKNPLRDLRNGSNS